MDDDSKAYKVLTAFPWRHAIPSPDFFTLLFCFAVPNPNTRAHPRVRSTLYSFAFPLYPHVRTPPPVRSKLGPFALSGHVGGAADDEMIL